MEVNHNTRVCVVGMGGLGCATSLACGYLGIKLLSLVDGDVVHPHNLHRQLWYDEGNVQHLKVVVAQQRLRKMFPRMRCTIIAKHVTADTAESLALAHDVLVDGTDQIATKFMLSDVSRLTGTPCVYGGAVGFRGAALRIATSGPCLRCLFEENDALRASLPPVWYISSRGCLCGGATSIAGYGYKQHGCILHG